MTMAVVESAGHVIAYVAFERLEQVRNWLLWWESPHGGNGKKQNVINKFEAGGKIIMPLLQGGF